MKIKAKVTYDIGKSGRKYYHYGLPSGGGGTLSQEDYEAVKEAFDNPILKYDFTKAENYDHKIEK